VKASYLSWSGVLKKQSTDSLSLAWLGITDAEMDIFVCTFALDVHTIQFLFQLLWFSQWFYLHFLSPNFSFHFFNTIALDLFIVYYSVQYMMVLHSMLRCFVYFDVYLLFKIGFAKLILLKLS
jgi:hypothetical protein